MAMQWLVLALLMLVADLRTTLSQDVKLVLATPVGPLRGLITTVTAEGIPATKVSMFLGIPFAEPPVGKLRFMAPQFPMKPWTTVRDALDYGNSCMQDLASHGVPGSASEDCLYLNVFAPFRNSSAAPLPVMVWIHGGAYRDGSSTLFDARALAARGQVVVVTMNYRTGAFGFLYAPTSRIAGNMGLLDQQAGIKWVRANIAAFHGDSSQVTIFGESAGAGSVNMHLLSPRIKGYFKRAIAESASMLSEFSVQGPTAITQNSLSLSTQLNCTKSTGFGSFYVDLKCLQSIPANVFLSVQLSMYALYASQFRPLPFAPVIEGDVIPIEPLTALKTQQFNQVELLIGVNSDEWAFFAMYFENSLPNMLQVLKPGETPPIPTALYNYVTDSLVDHGYYGFSAAASSNVYVKDTVKFAYTNWNDPDSGGERLRSLIQTGNDFVFFCPLQAQADLWSQPANAAKGAKTYLYQFSHYLPIFPQWVGVGHTAEIPYVFGDPLLLKASPTQPPAKPGTTQNYYVFTEEDRQLSLTMIDIWTTFAKTGNPSGGLPASSNFTEWPIYNSTTRPYVDLDTQVTLQSHLHNEKCQLLGHLAPVLADNCKGPKPSTVPAPRPQTATCPTLDSNKGSQADRIYEYVILALAIGLGVCVVVITILLIRMRMNSRTTRYTFASGADVALLKH